MLSFYKQKRIFYVKINNLSIDRIPDNPKNKKNYYSKNLPTILKSKYLNKFLFFKVSNH